MFKRPILVLVLLLWVPLAAQEAAFQGTMSLGRAGESPHAAGDLTGSWKGTVVTNGVSIPFFLILNREGEGYTATAGPAADQQIPIPNVRVKDGVIRFPFGRSGNVELRLIDDRLTGGILQGRAAASAPEPAAPAPNPPAPAAPAAPPAPRPAPVPPPPAPAPAAAPTPAPAAIAPATPAQGLDAAIARIDAMVAEEMSKENLASVTVGIVSAAKLAWTKSYGLADIEGNRPATPDNVYRIGSITKQFTALMLLQLAGEGKVHYTDPVEKYIPELSSLARPYAGAPPITLFELATHISGLIREPMEMATFVKGPVAKWEETTLAAIPKLQFVYEPGTHYSYSNIGYALLGLALGRAAHQPYTEYVAEHIFRPLGMTHTGFEPDAAMREHLAKGYVVRDGKADPSEAAAELESGRGYKVPNGAIFTTVDDLARFVMFEMGDGPETVLPRKAVLANLSRTASANGDLTEGHGIGFVLRRKGDLVFAGHSGATAGYSAQAHFIPGSHTGLIVLRNASGRTFDADFVMRAMDALAK